ncbi:hypothetical protein [Lacrimispora sp. 38-1]|uniref:hypothetical protein n=1 Tax=Lacrimispora sp. 38-1 TaxID=3125778 RepID=UPI003CFB6A17
MSLWATCKVTSTGPAEDGNIYIGLRSLDVNPPFTNWFKAVEGERKEMLATALTAISTGNNVTTLLTDSKPYSIINRLYIHEN